MYMRFSLFLTILFFLFSCEVINNEEDIPSIITIESIEVNGNHSSKITDAWVYIDNEFQDFDIPQNIYFAPINYNTGQKSNFTDKQTIIESFKSKDINRINNKELEILNNYDKPIKYRQYY